jgi:SAM-dependent methyltransferase
VRSSSPRIVRNASASARIVRRFTSGISALHGGIWLGLMNDETLAQSTEEFYATNNVFLKTDHNLSGLYIWEQESVARHAPSSGRVLIPAAGAGREVIALASMGYEAVGYDPSPDLVEVGSRLIADTGSDATLFLSHGNDLPPDLEQPFDWILFGWTGINHISGRPHRESVFRSLFGVLAPGGVLIVSFNARTADDRHLEIEQRLGGWIRRLRRAPDAVEPGDTFNGYFSHLFTFDELSSELATAGFAEIERRRSPFPVLVVRKPSR